MNKTIELGGTDWEFEEALDFIFGNMNELYMDLDAIEEHFPEKISESRNSCYPTDWDEMTSDFRGALALLNRIQNWFWEQRKEGEAA